MIKVLCIAVTLCVSATTLFAQEEVAPLPFSAKLSAVYVVFAKPILNCQCLKTEEVPVKKRSLVFSFDVPVVSSWDTVEDDRIKNHTVQQGSSMSGWVKTAKSDSLLFPRIVFSTPNFRIKAEGGVMKFLIPNSRTITQRHLVLERSIWFVLAGADGFFSQEQAPDIIKGVNFSADFRRLSVGRQGWLGVKLGGFNRNFLAVRYGRGYTDTKGETHFNVSGIDGLDWFTLYSEEFKTEFLSVEGKIRAKRISQSLRIDGVEYRRVTPSPDPLRFGENRFQDLWLTAETEIAPFPKVNFLRGVVVLTKDFGNKNRLMFFNDYSAVRFFVRLSFD